MSVTVMNRRMGTPRFSTTVFVLIHKGIDEADINYLCPLTVLFSFYNLEFKDTRNNIHSIDMLLVGKKTGKENGNRQGVPNRKIALRLRKS